MIIFALFAVPLTFLLLSAFTGGIGLTDRNTWKTFFFAVLLAIPSFILLQNIRRIFPSHLNPQSIFFHVLLNEHFFLLMFPLGLYFLVNGLMYRHSREFTGGIDRLFPFISGFYAITILSDILMAPEHRDIYVLFLQPALRISAVLLLTLGLVLFNEQFGWKKYVALLIPLLSLLVSATSTTFYWSGFPLVSLTLAVVILSGSVTGFLIYQKK